MFEMKPLQIGKKRNFKIFQRRKAILLHNKTVLSIKIVPKKLCIFNEYPHHRFDQLKSNYRINLIEILHCNIISKCDEK